MLSKSFTNNFLYFACGIAFMMLASRVFQKHTDAYSAGVEATMQEAFENGLAQEFVLKDNAVGLRWIETHKLGYEN
jgi:hypothetical protein